MHFELFCFSTGKRLEPLLGSGCEPTLFFAKKADLNNSDQPFYINCQLSTVNYQFIYIRLREPFLPNVPKDHSGF